jgi:hypothetical protein
MELTKRLEHFEQGGTVENPKALLREAIAEIEQLQGAIQRVRDLHYATRDITDEYVCCGCGEYASECRTHAALDGETHG